LSLPQDLRSELSQLIGFSIQSLAESGVCQDIVSDLVKGVDYSVVRAKLLPEVVRLAASELRSIDRGPGGQRIRPADELFTGLLMRYLERSRSCEFSQSLLDDILDELGPLIQLPRPNVTFERFQAVSPIFSFKVEDSAAGFDVGEFTIRPASAREHQLMHRLASIEQAVLPGWEPPELLPLWVAESYVDVTLDLDEQISAVRSISTTQDASLLAKTFLGWRTKFLQQFRKTQGDVRTLLLALRLLKTEPVFIPQVHLTNVLLPWQSFSMPLSASIYEHLWENAYCLFRSDIPRVKNLYTNLSDTLRRAGEEKRRAYLLTAASQFNKAGDEIDAADAFVHYVIALEAMYLRAVEKMELKRRVCERAATLLYDVVDRPEAYETVGRLYDLRSAIVHAVLSESKKKGLEMHRGDIRELVRRSFLCFADLDRVYDNKDDILSLLDKSLLEGEDRPVSEIMRGVSLFRSFLEHPID